jgi:hypothetical protein
MQGSATTTIALDVGNDELEQLGEDQVWHARGATIVDA